MNSLSCVASRAFAVASAMAILGLAAPSSGQAAEEVDIAGEYTCRGSNPGGGTYSGKVVIHKTKQTYKVQWKIATGTYFGVAIREGNVLSVCFVSKESVGVVSYKIEEVKDGARLVGRWAGFGGQETQSETLTRGAPLPGKSDHGPPSFTRSVPDPGAQANLVLQ